jgi:two-component system LytT family response regulator
MITEKPADGHAITVAIVDDEPLARTAVRESLKRWDNITIVGEASNGHEAVELIRAVRPALVFLDVRMPILDGFGVLEQVAAFHVPIVIFLTAYDQYALRAFEARAMDYLLKPFSPSRFDSAVEQACLQITRAGELESHRRAISLMEEERRATRRDEARKRVRRFTVQHKNRIVLVDADDIDWVESAGNYVEIHATGGSHLLRMTMNELEAQLDSSCFARIHRSTIVQINRVREISPTWHDFKVTLRDGTVRKMSRHYRDRLIPPSR